MSKIDLTEDEIQFITSERFTEDFWLFELAKTSLTEGVSGDSFDHDFYSSFFDRGKNAWNGYTETLREKICDVENCMPKSMFNDLLNGDKKTLIETLLGIVMSIFDLALGAAIPIVALVLKKGIEQFCSC